MISTDYFSEFFLETKTKLKKKWNNKTPQISCSGVITLSKFDEMYPIAIPNINAHSKFGENLLRFAQVIVMKLKYECVTCR